MVVESIVPERVFVLGMVRIYFAKNM